MINATYRFGLDLDDNGRFSTVTCLPENTFAIESSNVTLILARRGNTHVPLASNLLSLDNKFQPYTFQTHAGIVTSNDRQNTGW